VSAAASLRLVLACATWERSAERRAIVADAAASDELDWAHWLSLVRYHRLAPHAYRQIEALGAAPAAIRHELATDARAVAERSLALTRQLTDLVRAFEAAGVLALPFKGPALALAAYGEIGARASTDLDVVVTELEIAGARAALIGAGYEARHGTSPAQERAVLHSFGHVVFVRAGAPAPVELHWRFASPRYPWSLPVDDVVARAQRRPIGGVELVVPESHDHALLQCMHGVRHQWQQLEWLVALREQVRRDAIDATTLIERAALHGSRRALLAGFALLRDLLGAEVPGPIDAAIGADAALAPLVRTMRAGIERGEPFDTLREPYVLSMRLMDRSRDRARYLLQSILAPTIREWELVRLPDALLPLYYPIRLGRLLFGRGQAVRRVTR